MSWARNSVGAIGDDIGLPDVTTADNGKIMEVEEGAWKLKEGSGGGGGIPAPASPSDGDVLTYDSDTSAWVAAAPSGGGGILVCTASPIPDDPAGNEILNKTWNEIYTAASNGIPVIIISDIESDVMLMWVNYVSNSELDPYSVIGYINGDELLKYSASSASGYPQTDYANS